MLVLHAIILLTIPAGILWLTHNYRWAASLGVIVLCYVGGLLAGNSGLLPVETLALREEVSEATIALALPMLLFTLDVRQWSGVAGKAMLSMCLATTSVVAVATALFFAFRDQGAETASHLAAMAVGVYTGGTPNLAAIKAGLDIPHGEYIVFHSLDTVVGATYLLAMLTVGIPVFRRLLLRPSNIQDVPGASAEHDDEDDYRPLMNRENRGQLMKILVLATLVLLTAMGLSNLLGSLFRLEGNSALIIVLLTTIGILLSLLPGVRALHLAYRAGMYLIYVFCFAVASMASLDDLRALDASVAIFVVGTVAGSLLLHALFCRVARIDSDTFMVTSVAAVCSPPFVPMLARALDNPGAILSGMTTGIIGYALGNYLGISLALFLVSV